MYKRFFIHHDGGHLYSVLHLPKPGLRTDTGIICFHPFFYEHFYVYPLTMAMSRVLDKMGVAVLRFDMKGYGNSQGEHTRIRIDDCLDLARLGSKFLKRELDVTNIGLMGFRSGANLALWAAESAQPDFLVLGDPILNMDQYFKDHLRKKTVVGTFQQLQKPTTVASLMRSWGETGILDFQGYETHKYLYDQMIVRANATKEKTLDIPAFIMECGNKKNCNQANGNMLSLGLNRTICTWNKVGYRPYWLRIKPIGDVREDPYIQIVASWLSQYRKKVQRTSKISRNQVKYSELFKSLRCEINTEVAQERLVHYPGIKSDLLGILHIPKQRRLDKAVIFLPGQMETASGVHQLYAKMSRKLAEQGIASLRFDYPSQGDGPNPETAYSEDDLLNDIGLSVEYLRMQSQTNHVSGIGLCLGARLMAVCMAKGIVTFDKLVFWSPTPLDLQATNEIKRLKSLLGRSLKNPMEFLQLILKDDLNTEEIKKKILNNISIARWMKKLKNKKIKKTSPAVMGADQERPSGALSIYGSGDPEAESISKMYTAFLSAYGIPSEQLTIKGADKIFRDVKVEKKLIEYTVSWLERPVYSPLKAHV